VSRSGLGQLALLMPRPQLRGEPLPVVLYCCGSVPILPVRSCQSLCRSSGCDGSRRGGSGGNRGISGISSRRVAGAEGAEGAEVGEVTLAAREEVDVTGVPAAWNV
jgi:hypothetical protein